ncbi:putative sulfate exporter family transporter [Schumannella soli]|uniref:Putative sulfate exporter family transporter n=1 Tax=Schumannella soli TaxID=2590779 RepID=A0A506Y698_9MICO|nr:putative sulfate exporter family transporter [Schumannella soli]
MRRLAPGILVCVVIAVAATLIGSVVPLVGSAVPGIVIGVVIALVRKPGAVLKPGIQFTSKRLLQLAVVLLGAQLSLGQIAAVGLESLPVMLGSLVVCLVGAWLIGRALGVVGDLRTLIGVGTGICGASAIAAVSPVIGAVSAEVAYAVSTIFLFNISAVIVFPLIGHALGLSPHAFGLFAGTAVNDTSSVVATAAVYGHGAANFAVVVKLVRTLMIIPITIGLAVLVGRRRAALAGGGDAVDAPGEDSGLEGSRVATNAHDTPAGASISGHPRLPEAAEARPAPPRLTPLGVLKLIPWFLIGFVVVAIVGSLGVIPAGAKPGLSAASVFLIAMTLSAIGLSTDIAAIRRSGWRPLVLGGALWALVTLTSLGIMWLTGAH